MKKRKEVRISTLACSSCGARVIRIREAFRIQQGTRVKRLVVKGGVLLTKSLSKQEPLCGDCLSRAKKFLAANPDPLRALLIIQ